MREQLLLFERAKSHDHSNYQFAENEKIRLTNNRLVVIPSSSGPLMKPNQGDVKAVLRDDQKDKDDEENDDDVEYIDFEK